jgi:hypothetical protein
LLQGYAGGDAAGHKVTTVVLPGGGAAGLKGDDDGAFGLEGGSGGATGLDGGGGGGGARRLVGDGSGAELEGGGGARCLVGAGDAQARPDSRVRAKRRRKRRKYGFPVGFFGGVLTADLDRMAHRARIVGLSTSE